MEGCAVIPQLPIAPALLQLGAILNVAAMARMGLGHRGIVGDVPVTNDGLSAVQFGRRAANAIQGRRRCVARRSKPGYGGEAQGSTD